MDPLRLKPVHSVEGDLVLPGSKSLSNRALLLAALARGTTTLRNLLDSDDIRRMLAALAQLGVPCELSADKTLCQVRGQGGPFHASAPLTLHLGNAGTAIRPLCAVLGTGTGTFTLGGDPRMEERPLSDLVDALRQAGAAITCLKNSGFPPVRIEAAGLRGGTLTVRGNVSSQFLSALLMAAPLFREPTVIEVDGPLVSQPYVQLTLAIIARFGGVISHNAFRRFEIPPQQTYRSPGELSIEGDASSASYFFAAAAIKGGSVRVRGLSQQSLQADLKFLDVLEKMGASVTWRGDEVEVRPSSPLRGLDLDAQDFPDAAMTVATTALFAEGTTTIRNVGNWRVKETDRLAAMAAELRKTGAEVTEGADFLEIHPPRRIRHAVVDTYEDHRMAMCFSLLALSEASVTINDPNCVSKTFPDYFEKFAAICR